MVLRQVRQVEKSERYLCKYHKNQSGAESQEEREPDKVDNWDIDRVCHADHSRIYVEAQRVEVLKTFGLQKLEKLVERVIIGHPGLNQPEQIQHVNVHPCVHRGLRN